MDLHGSMQITSPKFFNIVGVYRAIAGCAKGYRGLRRRPIAGCASCAKGYCGLRQRRAVPKGYCLEINR